MTIFINRISFKGIIRILKENILLNLYLKQSLNWMFSNQFVTINKEQIRPITWQFLSIILFWNVQFFDVIKTFFRMW